MSAEHSADHWAKLLAEMGIQPAPEKVSEPAASDEDQAAPPPVSEESPAPEAAELPTEPVTAEQVAAEAPVAEEVQAPPAPKAKERPRPNSDWDRLAADLGLPVAPRPPKPAPPAPVAKVVEPVAPVAEPDDEPAAESPTFDRPSRFGELPEAQDKAEAPDEEFKPSIASKEWEDEMGELSDPLLLEGDNLADEDDEDQESSADTSAEEPTEASAGEATGETKKTGRRRRRRRRGRRLPETESAETDIQEVDLEAAAESVELIDTDPGLPTAATGGETAPSAEGEESPERRRRRRRRRRRKDSEGPSTSQPAGEHREAGEQVEPEPADESAEEWEEGAAGSEDDGDEERMPRLSHRAIPTWDEAIQMIISRNLESRAKNPNSGSSQRGRGHRRPREKPSGK